MTIPHPILARGPEGEKKRVNLYRTAFHDLRLNIEELLADGENRLWLVGPAAVSIKGSSTGIAPTGKAGSLITGVTICRFANGKIVEGFVNWDCSGASCAQLGAVPEACQIHDRRKLVSLPFPEKPKSLPRMLSYGGRPLLSSLSNVALTFKSARRASGGLLGSSAFPLRRVAEPLTLGTISGAATLVVFKGAGFVDFSFVPSSASERCY